MVLDSIKLIILCKKPAVKIKNLVFLFVSKKEKKNY
jgi:hypothetical protein